MGFSQEFIEKVRDANSIVEVISRFTQLKRSGSGRMVGLCPFPDHNEKTASFSVSEDRQMYYCFGCKKTGGVYTAIQALQGMNFPEAVEHLARKASITIDDNAYEKGTRYSKDNHKTEEKNNLWQVAELAAYFYQSNLARLPEDHPFKQYCQKRGLTSEIIRQFQIGAVLDEWEGLVNYLTSKKVPMALVEKLGLVRARTKGKEGHYDLFRNRLMFTIVSQTGRYIGFGGRVLGDELPKYINSTESEIFNKGKIFYGLNETAKYIRTADEVIVVEGYMDFLALYGAGIKNVVATLGTALTKDHAKLIKRFTKRVVVLFDGDSAGQTAADRSLPILLQEGLLPRGLTLPNNQDPDDFLQESGADALKELIRSSQELFIEFFNRHMKGFRGGSADKVVVMDKVGPVMLQITDPRLGSLYLNEVAQRLGMDIGWVRKSLVLQKKSAPKPPIRPLESGTENVANVKNMTLNQDELRKIKVLRPEKAELFLLNLSLIDESLFKEAMELKVVEAFTHKALREVFERAQEIYVQMPNNFGKLTALLVDQVDPPEIVTRYMENDLSGLEMVERQKMFKDCENRIRAKYMRGEARQLSSNLNFVSKAEQNEKLEQIMNIQRRKHNLGKSKDTN